MSFKNVLKMYTLKQQAELILTTHNRNAHTHEGICITLEQVLVLARFNKIEQDCHLEIQLYMAGGLGSPLAYRDSNLSV